ncbi:MAG TPA: isoprenylcysteine carboxylmethyltransferase family protein [Allosphingosinicella sp.]|nr:isoprenylcysteine carboxylmethyltransferase family protein [Allosphingosinicella sp.]
MGDNPRVYVPPPLLALAVLAAGLAIDGRLAAPPDGPILLKVGAGALIVSGILPIAIALGLFRRRKTRPEPWAPSSALVVEGIYRFTRNPMYLGMMLVYAGLALLFQSLTAFLLLAPLAVIFDRLVIAREEAYLARRFGAAYASYRAQVRRWL